MHLRAHLFLYYIPTLRLEGMAGIAADVLLHMFLVNFLGIRL